MLYPARCLAFCAAVFLLFAAGAAAQAPTAAESAWQRMWVMHEATCQRHVHEEAVTIAGAGRQAWVEHALVAADYDAHTRVPATTTLRGLGKTAQATATINVSYTGFPSAARTAFQFAADIWETHIASPVPIDIDASWQALEAGVLGSAGARYIEANQPYLPRTNTWYPIALAEALAGRNLTGSEADIQARFNSDFSNWYFGTDGRTPTGQYDLATVVLHEIGHGLGFFDSFDYDDGDASNGPECGGQVGVGCGGYQTSGGQEFPVIFDRFLVSLEGKSILSFPNPSASLGGALQSRVFFDGETVRLASGDIPVDLYAPQNFEPGSSIAHLDEQTFPAGDPNSLMTPQLARAESIFSPGAFTCAIFRDIGWTLGPDCDVLLGADILEFTAEATGGGNARLVIRTGPTTSATRIDVLQRYFNDPVEVVESLAVTPGQAFEVDLENLEPGRYLFQLRIVRADNTVLPGPEVEVSVPLRDLFTLRSLTANPFEGQARLSLQVKSRQNVDARLFNAAGQLVGVLLNEQLAPSTRTFLEVDGGALGSGVYFLVVRGETFTETRKLIVLR